MHGSNNSGAMAITNYNSDAYKAYYNTNGSPGDSISPKNRIYLSSNMNTAGSFNFGSPLNNVSGSNNPNNSSNRQNQQFNNFNNTITSNGTITGGMPHHYDRPGNHSGTMPQSPDSNAGQTNATTSGNQTQTSNGQPQTINNNINIINNIT